jgi:hypothetical protein
MAQRYQGNVPALAVVSIARTGERGQDRHFAHIAHTRIAVSRGQ